MFTYSHEEDTHAYNYEDDVPESKNEERVAEIMQVQQQISREKNEQQIGKIINVLIDRKEGTILLAGQNTIHRMWIMRC